MAVERCRHSGGIAGHERRAVDRDSARRGSVQRRTPMATYLVKAKLLHERAQHAGVLGVPRDQEVRAAAGEARACRPNQQWVTEQRPDVGVVVEPLLLKLRDQCGLAKRREWDAVQHPLEVLDRRRGRTCHDARDERAVLREVREARLQRARTRCRPASGNDGSDQGGDDEDDLQHGEAGRRPPPPPLPPPPPPAPAEQPRPVGEVLLAAA